MDKLQGRILVVDDDPEMGRLLKDVLTEERHAVQMATNGKEALDRLSDETDLMITDLNLKEMKGLDLMHRVKQHYPGIAVIIITAFGTIESALEAMKQGAYDYIPKPFKMEELTLVVQKALRENALRREVARLRREVGREYQFANIIGKSKAMGTVFDLIRRVAGSSSNLLITGESGTGKELIAKAIHYNSPRKDRPFIPVNCAAIPEALLESELFGHVRGAFTDAKSDKVGLFQEAADGTLFLDEIGELPTPLQAKLLRAIQDKEIRRVGSTQQIKVDVRIIAASNSDLTEEVKQRRFRDDLFYRINVIQIHLPPLRDRRDDILPLALHFLKKYQEDVGKPVKGFSEPALSLLVRYPWPGNVRELENVVERAVILMRGDEVLPEDLPPAVTGNQDDYSAFEKAMEQQQTLEELERQYIARILEKTGGNKNRAARILGIDRKTLYRKLAQAPEPDSDRPLSENSF